MELTPKQAIFRQEYINTLGNATEAAMRAYDVKDRNVAKTIGYQNVTKLHMNIKDIMEAAGLTDEFIIQKIKDKAGAKKTIISNGKAYQDEDHAIQLKAVELASKIRGLLNDKVEVTGKDGGEIVIKVKEDRELIEVREGETEDEEE